MGSPPGVCGEGRPLKWGASPGGPLAPVCTPQPEPSSETLEGLLCLSSSPGAHTASLLGGASGHLLSLDWWMSGLPFHVESPKSLEEEPGLKGRVLSPGQNIPEGVWDETEVPSG